MNIYQGVRDRSRCQVTVNGKPLDPRRDLRDHAAGFEWASEGGGATQLALAILADHAGEEVALAASRKFASAVVAGLPFEGWTLVGNDVDMALAVIETQA